MNIFLPDIPRIYTALAEWISCMIYIFPLRKRIRGKKLIAALAVSGTLQCVFQEAAGRLQLTLWIPGMLLNVLLMLLTIWVCCDLKWKDAGYWCARAFVTAEFAAALEWQIFSYLVWNGMEWNELAAFGFMLFCYACIFPLVFLVEKRIVSEDTGTLISTREVTVAIIVVVIVFAMSNIGFVLEDSLYGRASGMILFYIRTLIDFCGLCILYIQQNQKNEEYLKQELGSIQNMFKLQYEQYLSYKENSDTINRKSHDLKHQIDVIRSEGDPEKREEYLREMETAVRNLKANIMTGNAVLDTILTYKNAYCVNHDIHFTCIADGKTLDFMHPLDICSIFGNALDNAIESAEKNKDKEKRVVSLKTFTQNHFLMICFENYCEDDINFGHGLPDSTKENKSYHGYGLKSIRYTAEKYGGSMTLHQENDWFILRVLIPVE